MELRLMSRVLGIAVGVTVGIAMPQTAAAQQSGRMQVRVTIVDVSQSRDVLTMLRRAAEPPVARSRFTTWHLPNALVIKLPVSTDGIREDELPREQVITVFYY